MSPTMPMTRRTCKRTYLYHSASEKGSGKAAERKPQEQTAAVHCKSPEAAGSLRSPVQAPAIAADADGQLVQLDHGCELGVRRVLYFVHVALARVDMLVESCHAPRLEPTQDDLLRASFPKLPGTSAWVVRCQVLLAIAGRFPPSVKLKRNRKKAGRKIYDA